MSTISTHVLDTSIGKPAVGIRVALERVSEPEGIPGVLGFGVTDAEGRLRDLLAPGAQLEEGTYRLRFEIAAYYAREGHESFYPEVIVTFGVAGGAEHYHVPLLLSPFGYSTYRGS